jgi:hypothetical protein
MEITEADVRRGRAALIQRVQANDSAQQSLSWKEMDGPFVDGEHIRWSDSELSAFFQALHTNTHVTYLMLDGRPMPQSAEVVQQFVDMLAANRSITDIRLWRCAVDASTLAQGLKQHPQLESLTLSDVKMTVDDMQSVFTALLECPALRSLRLFLAAEFVSSAMTELCTLLHCSGSLRGLNLEHSTFHGAPLRQLADALSANKQLHSLHLRCDQCDDDDAHYLADMLRKNHTLTTLDLYCNPGIGEAGWRVLTDALRDNRTLTEIDTSSCTISEEDRLFMDACLARNKQRRADPPVLSVLSAAVGSAPSVVQPGSLPAARPALVNEPAPVEPASPSPVIARAPASSVASDSTGQLDDEALSVTEPQPVSPIHTPPRRLSGDGSVSEPCVPTSAELAAPMRRLSGEESVCEPCVPTAAELQSMAIAAAARRVYGGQGGGAVKEAGVDHSASPRPLSAEGGPSVLSAPSVSPSASSTAAAAAAAPAAVASPSAIPTPPTAAAEEAALLQLEALLLGQLSQTQQRLGEIRAARA